MAADFTRIDVADVPALIDAFKHRHGIKSDAALSRRLGVSEMAIYRWRRGQIEPATLALMTLTFHLPIPDSALLAYAPAA
jgi:hypothetical protein